MSRILGIDPGLNGALALYHVEQSTVATWAMPTMQTTVHGHTRTTFDIAATLRWLRSMELWIDHVIIEVPAGMAGRFAAPAFTFGFQCGALIALVAACHYPYTLVPPATWKGKVHLDKSKDGSRKRATQLFPSDAQQWKKRNQDGHAEAALLAWYGYHVRRLR